MAFGLKGVWVKHQFCLQRRLFAFKKHNYQSSFWGRTRNQKISWYLCFFLTIFLVTNMSTSQLTLVSVLCIDPHTSTVLIMYFPRNIRFRSSKNNEHLYICLDRDGGCEATEEGGALLNNTPSSSSFLSCLGIVNHTPPHQSSSLPAKKLSQLIEGSHPQNLTRSSN